MTTPTTPAPKRVSSADEAWARWGWLMGGVWLFFFLFPLGYIWTTDLGLVTQVAGTVLIVAFAAIYIATLRVATGLVTRGEFARARVSGTTGLVVLVAVSVTLALLIGPNALTAMPFLVSLPVFFLPWRATWMTALGLLVVGIVGSFLAWGLGSSFMWGIAVMVLAISILSRYLEEKSDTARDTDARLQVTEERERVARDVHDVLGHSLTIVTMKTELAQRLVDVDPERAKAELAEVQDLARTALAEIRATVAGLRVARLADEMESARVALAGAGIEADLPQDVSVVDPRHRITVAWVLREAVTNVVRHSRAEACRVRLASDGLVVEDDGRGTGGRREGNGIRGLRERVAQAGGQIDIGPGPTGRGTRLEVRL